jgi:DNA replication protein DnaC
LNEQSRQEERRIFAWKQRVDENIRASGIPNHTRARKLADLTLTEGNRRAVGLVKLFLEEQITPPIMLIIGVPGVGKTTLAYMVAWPYLEDGSTVAYFQTEDLLNELQAALMDGHEFGRLWARLKEADLVILDDLGAQNRTPWRDSQLDALVDFRYRERLPLVMTANKVEISERILDRVREGQSVMITGESWRGKAK